MAENQVQEAETQPGEGAEGAEGADAAAAGKKKKKLLLMASVAMAVVGAAIGGGVFFMMSGGDSHEEEAVEVQSFFFDVPQFAVNLMDDGGEAHFLKLKVALELGSENDLKTVGTLVPVLQDDYQAFLRQLRVEDLRGNAALARLKEALLLRANQVLSPVKVKNVLFREVLVQ